MCASRICPYVIPRGLPGCVRTRPSLPHIPSLLIDRDQPRSTRRGWAATLDLLAQTEAKPSLSVRAHPYPYRLGAATTNRCVLSA